MNFDETMTVCNDYIDQVVLPLLDVLEDTVVKVADDMEECASPHHAAFVAVIYELVTRGWTIEELIDQLKIHGPEATEMISDVKRGLN